MVELAADPESVKFLEKINLRKYNGEIVHEEFLHIYSKKSGEKLGDFTLAVSEWGNNEYHIRGSCKGVVENVDCGTTVRALIPQKGLQTLQQEYTEYLRHGNMSLEKYSTITHRDKKDAVVLDIKETAAGNDKQHQITIAEREVSGFVGEGACLMLLRFLGLVACPDGYFRLHDGTEIKELTLLTLDSNNERATVTMKIVGYEQCEEADMSEKSGVNDSNGAIMGKYVQIDRVLQNASQSNEWTFTMKGSHIMHWDHKNSPVYIKRAEFDSDKRAIVPVATVVNTIEGMEMEDDSIAEDAVINLADTGAADKDGMEPDSLNDELGDCEDNERFGENAADTIKPLALTLDVNKLEVDDLPPHSPVSLTPRSMSRAWSPNNPTTPTSARRVQREKDQNAWQNVWGAAGADDSIDIDDWARGVQAAGDDAAAKTAHEMETVAENAAEEASVADNPVEIKTEQASSTTIPDDENKIKTPEPTTDVNDDIFDGPIYLNSLFGDSDVGWKDQMAESNSVIINEYNEQTNSMVIGGISVDNNPFQMLGEIEPEATTEHNLEQEVDQKSSLNDDVVQEDGQKIGLNDDVVQEDGQKGGLNDDSVEEDGQKGGLNDDSVEEDGQKGGLNDDSVEEDGQKGGLNDDSVEEDGQKSSLNDAVVQEDGQKGGINDDAVQEDGQKISPILLQAEISALDIEDQKTTTTTQSSLLSFEPDPHELEVKLIQPIKNGAMDDAPLMSDLNENQHAAQEDKDGCVTVEQVVVETVQQHDNELEPISEESTNITNDSTGENEKDTNGKRVTFEENDAVEVKVEVETPKTYADAAATFDPSKNIDMTSVDQKREAMVRGKRRSNMQPFEPYDVDEEFHAAVDNMFGETGDEDGAPANNEKAEEAGEAKENKEEPKNSFNLESYLEDLNEKKEGTEKHNEFIEGAVDEMDDLETPSSMQSCDLGALFESTDSLPERTPSIREDSPSRADAVGDGNENQVMVEIQNIVDKNRNAPLAGTGHSDEGIETGETSPDEKVNKGQPKKQWDPNELKQRFEQLKAAYDSESRVYMQEHTEVRPLISEFIQALLLTKPNNVHKFAAVYFQMQAIIKETDA